MVHSFTIFVAHFFFVSNDDVSNCFAFLIIFSFVGFIILPYDITLIKFWYTLKKKLYKIIFVILPKECLQLFLDILVSGSTKLQKIFHITVAIAWWFFKFIVKHGFLMVYLYLHIYKLIHLVKLHFVRKIWKWLFTVQKLICLFFALLHSLNNRNLNTNFYFRYSLRFLIKILVIKLITSMHFSCETFNKGNKSFWKMPSTKLLINILFSWSSVKWLFITSIILSTRCLGSYLNNLVFKLKTCTNVLDTFFRLAA